MILDNNQKKLMVSFEGSGAITEAPLSFEYLRISSPSNNKKKNKTGQIQVTSHKKNVVIINIESVAKHGYRLIFDDDHSAIYCDEYIHTLVLENESRWALYLNDLKESGHSREAMINFKQL